jgi:hypothetical protein
MVDNGRPNPRATWAAVIFVCALGILGIWIFVRLDASQKAQNCIESGSRKCAIIDAERPR